MIWLALFIIWFVGCAIAFYLREKEEYRWLRECGYEGEMLFRAMSAFPATSICFSLFSWYMVVSMIREKIERKRLDRLIKKTIKERTPEILRYMNERNSSDQKRTG